MIEVINNIIGRPYTPILSDYMIDNDVGILASGSIDWEWIIAASIFALCVFCLFRLLGGVLRD